MTTTDTADDQDGETAALIGLETVVQEAMNEFDSVAAVTVGHVATYERPGSIRVTIYTGEADRFEDYLQLFSDEHRIVIDRGKETLLVPFTVFATFDGPGTYDSVGRTTIYMDENVLGAQPLQIEDGLAYVQDKLEDPEQWDRDREKAARLDRIRNYSD
jgi:hypothetical protein